VEQGSSKSQGCTKEVIRVAGEKSPAITLMYTLNQIKIILQESKEFNKPYLFKGLLNETPGWQNFIDHIDHQYWNNKIAEVPSNPYRERFIRGVLFKNPLYLNVVAPKEELYPQINSFFNLFDQAIPYRGMALSAYVNFAKEQPSEPHFDETDNFYWQCIGKTFWKFYSSEKRSFSESNIDNKSEGYIEFEVEPGDVVYIPRGMIHDVQTIGPRAALQFKYNIPEVGFSFN
jgi:hypothetical protein